MSDLLDHLRSPQFTDEHGNPTGPARVSLVVAPGKPRWLGYLFYGAGFILGAVLALGLIDLGGEIGADIVRIIGVVGMVGAVYGAWEVWRGRPPSFRGIVGRIRHR